MNWKKKWNEIASLDSTESHSQPNLNLPTSPLNQNLTDEEIFQAIIGESFWEFLANETNKYYHKKLEMSKTKQYLEDHKKARITAFKETSTEEIKAYIGLYLYMGLNKRPEQKGKIFVIYFVNFSRLFSF